MKRQILMIAVLFAAFNIRCQSNELKHELANVEWLLAKWTRENVKEGRSGFEIWEKSGTELIGKGISLRGVDTVFVEKLRIVVKDNVLNYVADVKENPAPVYFAFTSITKNGFVCENPQHDFPKKIEYKWDGSKLVATISGNGKSFDYIFSKR